MKIYIFLFAIGLRSQTTPVGQGNSQQCSQKINQATSIIQTMEQLAAATQQRGAGSTNPQTLTQNLRDLKTYETAVATIGPIMNSAAACAQFTATNQRLSATRQVWAGLKPQTRTVQLQQGVDDNGNGGNQRNGGGNNAAGNNGTNAAAKAGAAKAGAGKAQGVAKNIAAAAKKGAKQGKKKR